MNMTTMHKFLIGIPPFAPIIPLCNTTFKMKQGSPTKADANKERPQKNLIKPDILLSIFPDKMDLIGRVNTIFSSLWLCLKKVLKMYKKCHKMLNHVGHSFL